MWTSLGFHGSAPSCGMSLVSSVGITSGSGALTLAAPQWRTCLFVSETWCVKVTSCWCIDSSNQTILCGNSHTAIFQYGLLCPCNYWMRLLQEDQTEFFSWQFCDYRVLRTHKRTAKCCNVAASSHLRVLIDGLAVFSKGLFSFLNPGKQTGAQKVLGLIDQFLSTHIGGLNLVHPSGVTLWF